MNAIATPPLRKYQHPVLQGLSEKALTAVYNAGVVKLISQQQWLFRAGEPVEADLLILDGSAGLYRQNAPGELAAQLFTGDMLPAALLQKDGYRTHDCIATTPVTLLQIEAQGLQQLDETTQLALLRNQQTAIGRLNHQLLQQNQLQRTQSVSDADSVLAYVMARQENYASATTLQVMLANLPKLPPYTTRITAMLNDPKASARNIVEIARQDPSITASVLKTVNSAWFGLTHKIKDFQHAVMMLGFGQMQQLLINTGVQSAMPNTPQFRQLQAHSMMISVLCGEISLTVKAGSAPMLSTLGILHDIGKSVVLLLKHQHPKQEFLLSQLDPDMVGMLLLREWQLPDNISGALQFQSWPELLPPDKLPREHRESAAVLFLAHRCLDRLRSLQTEVANPASTRPWLTQLGCREQTLDDFLIGRLIPAINSRNAPLPLALQDMLRKAQRLEGDAQPKSMSTAP